MWRPASLAADLEGLWRFERNIDNGVRVFGEATLTPYAGGLRYREDGRMRLPGGAELPAYAAYLFVPRPVRLDILFDETPPRLFQRFDLQAMGDAWLGESEHECPPDLYRSSLRLHPDGGWSLEHAVAGPRKGYLSRTAYRRGQPLQEL